MNPLPARMADRWQTRAEPGPGEAQFYWQILMRDQPQVRALAAVARERLTRFSGLHFTPEQWLPECLITIDTIHLIAQHGAERAWNWQPVAAIPIGS
jgi:hypothetical protein